MNAFWNLFMNSPRREPKRLIVLMARIVILTLMAMVLMGSSAEPGQGVDAQKVRKIQAAYLLNFLKFMKWPDSKHASDDSPLVIGVVGDDSFARTLGRTVKNKTVRGRPVEILRLVPRDIQSGLNKQYKSCHLLFVASTQERNVLRWIPELHRASVVTVSDLPDFARRGGMIGFVVKERKIRFQANVQSIRKSEVVVSSKLLKLAEIVESK